MTQTMSRPRKVLAVMDDSDTQVALHSAASLAEHHGARLEVMACIEPPHDLAIIARLSDQTPEALIAEMEDRLRGHISDRIANLFPERTIRPHVAIGKAFLEIIRHVDETGCDFVVKTAEPLAGVARFLLASTDQHLLRKCPCPVWLQTADAPTSPKRVLAAVDLDLRDAAEPDTLTGLNRAVLEVACGIAAAPEAEVIVLHAWEALGEGMVWAFSDASDARLSADLYVNEILNDRQNAMRDLLAAARDGGGQRPRLTSCLARGPTEHVIEDQRRQHDADVVVMGTVARTGLSGVFIGNTAENIINNLEGPVLAVKPDGFVSPLLRR